ncbi:MAG: four-carbon acid sugar kinase family protein [Synergistaceae bacterium]|nr:four-carbon acid sugar kinase family protein [Synergistaceae bacterium]
MLKLLIVADDFTGALDSGVQFAALGADTKVITDSSYDLSKVQGLDVLIFDAETRHVTKEEAYKKIFDFVKRAAALNVPYVYKKTDSGLRGNIGSELAGAMDALCLDTMSFIPAFPKMNRITRGGVHYVDGVPVAQSMFGQDPFEPVKFSSVNEIIKSQTDKTGIKIFDAEKDSDLLKIAEDLKAQGALKLTAGCAGFAACLAKVIGFSGEAKKIPAMPKKFFMVCGSVNPVTKKQVDYAHAKGFKKICLNVEQKLNPSWPGSQSCNEAAENWLKEIQNFNAILDANNPNELTQTEEYIKSHGLDINQVRLNISRAVTGAAKALLDKGLEARLMCVGGDTLLALMEAVGVHELVPLCEIEKGVVLTAFNYKDKNYFIMTKSGGFGEEDLLTRLAENF